MKRKELRGTSKMSERRISVWQTALRGSLKIFDLAVWARTHRYCAFCAPVVRH